MNFFILIFIMHFIFLNNDKLQVIELFTLLGKWYVLHRPRRLAKLRYHRNLTWPLMSLLDQWRSQTRPSNNLPGIVCPVFWAPLKVIRILNNIHGTGYRNEIFRKLSCLLKNKTNSYRSFMFWIMYWQAPSQWGADSCYRFSRNHQIWKWNDWRCREFTEQRHLNSENG